MAPGEISDALRVNGRPVSMDAPIGSSDDDGNMYDVLKDNDASTPDVKLLNESLQREINRSLSTLTAREADVIRMYYGLDCYTPHTLEEIGDVLGLTRERVRQIKEKAILRLKNKTRSKILKTYLG
jgi:RNA polymerase primary sigma factor